jgi:hypothetical protein
MSAREEAVLEAEPAVEVAGQAVHPQAAHTTL